MAVCENKCAKTGTEFPFLTDSRLKSVGRAKGILTTQGFLFFCPGILQVMVSYGIIEKGGIICS